jgi:phosphatidylinositol alpha-1,6-mannosyltransferase
MRILFISPGCFDKGGISRYNRFQIQILNEIFGKEQVRVVSLLGPDKNSFEDPIDVDWHGKRLNISNKILFIFKIFEIMILWRPKYVNVGHVNLIAFPLIFSYLLKSKVILNVYGLEVWSKLTLDAQYGLNHVKYLISDCFNTADYLIQSKKLRPKKLEVIWDCVDTKRYIPSIAASSVYSKYGIKEDKDGFYILTLGRLSLPDAKYKGYDNLLEVFAKLKSNYPNLYLIVGGGGNYLETLRVKIENYNLVDSVFFTGFIDEVDMPSIYQIASIFSLVTKSGPGMGEGIPLTPLEAMSCGKPIVVGDMDGSREAIFGNRNGYSVDPKNLDLLAQILEIYISQSDLYLEHSRNSREIAVDNFSYEVFKSKYRMYFNQIDGC